MEYKSMAKMGHSPNEMESVKQEKKDLMNDNPVARDASGGRPMILKHMGGSKIGGSPLKKHDGKKFEDEGFMDSHFKSGKPRK
jgi:hypothetical protein